MREPLKVWRLSLVDEGRTTAIYPYVQLREILDPDDWRLAIIDEIGRLEEEFGQAIVQPLYELLWVLNSGAGMFTSHTTVAPYNHQSPYNWAKNYVGVAIITLSRNHAEHLDIDACQRTVDELGHIISARAPQQDSTGWYLTVGSCNVIFTREMSLTSFRSFLPEHIKGYGCQLIIGGAANNRRTAAIRWSQAVTFVTSAIHRTQQGENVIPAMPHRHAIPGALPKK
jgi:hypothetical protein